MKTTNKIKLGGLTGALLVSLFSANAFAAHPGYLDDQATGSVVRNSYNECWRTAYFDKAKDGLVECGDAEAKAAPAPVVAVPVKETLSLSAEVLFGFDKSTVTPEGKQALVDVANKIKSKGAKLQGVEVLATPTTSAPRSTTWPSPSAVLLPSRTCWLKWAPTRPRSPRRPW